MDSGSQSYGRKIRFRPRRPSLRPTSNTEAEAEEESRNAAQQIANRIGTGQRRPETDTTGSFGVPKVDDKGASSSSAHIPPAVSSATTREYGEEVHNFVARTEGDYVEPWDYNSYYPTVLPLRRPYSGDPELLDQEEFGEGAKHRDKDKKTMTAAEELGLTSEQHGKERMFLFKIPDCLPVMKQSVGATTKESVPESSSMRSNPFEGLPEGFMGKMQVYKSGAVKLKLGEILFDVSPGPNLGFPNVVAAINTNERKFCHIGSFEKIVTVTPDVESLLKSDSDKETHK